MSRRVSLILGVMLIALGVIYWVGQFIPAAWPLPIVLIGAAFFTAGLLGRPPDLAVSGAVVAAVGLILFYQSNSGDWASWYWLWPLVMAALGLGVLVAALRGRRSPGMRNTGVVFLVEGVVFTAVLWFFRAAAWVSWPAIVAGLGAFFLLAAFLLRAGGLAIPGMLLGVIGVILGWQNTSGNWESWSYLWAAIPAAVGMGLALLSAINRTSRAVWLVGLYLLASSAIVLAIFGGVFGRGELPLLAFWPVLIVLAGVLLLIDALAPRAR